MISQRPGKAPWGQLTLFLTQEMLEERSLVKALPVPLAVYLLQGTGPLCPQPATPSSGRLPAAASCEGRQMQERESPGPGQEAVLTCLYL